MTFKLIKVESERLLFTPALGSSKVFDNLIVENSFGKIEFLESMSIAELDMENAIKI